MWAIGMLKKNAWNSLNGYYRKSVAVVVLAIGSTLLGLAVITMLHASFASGMMQPYSTFGTQPDPSEIRDMYMPIIIRLFYYVLCVVLSFLLLIVYTNPVEVGVCSFFRKARTGDAKIGEMFYAFHDARYRRILWTMLCRMPYICITYLAFEISTIGGLALFFIPIGILVLTGLYQYTLVPFILSENPRLSSKRVTEISKRTMDGEKMSFFLLQLSFIGWFLLGVITCGFGFLFSIPYYQATKAEFYACMRAKMIAQGITTEEELTGAVIPQTQQQPYRYDMLQTGGQ